MAALAAAGQRYFDPTVPIRGRFALDGKPQTFELPRRQSTSEDAPVELRLQGDVPSTSATLHFRTPTEDSFIPIEMQERRLRTIRPGEKPVSEVIFAAPLPRQRAGELLEYFVTLAGKPTTVRLPDREAVRLQYANPLPEELRFALLAAWAIAIFVGLRAGLAAILAPESTRRYAWITLALATVALTAGAIGRQREFGSYWQGFPIDGDWADNARLAIWVAWVAACGCLGPINRGIGQLGRGATVSAALFAIVAFVVPVLPANVAVASAVSSRPEAERSPSGQLDRRGNPLANRLARRDGRAGVSLICLVGLRP